MDNSTMNGGNYEVETEVSGASEVAQEVTFESAPAGPSKGFIAGCVGFGAAAITGIVLAVRHHKKKKRAKAQEAAEADYDDYDDEYYDDEIEELEEVETKQVAPEQQTEPEKTEEKK